jgi:CheY-like chemotaxis protein
MVARRRVLIVDDEVLVTAALMEIVEQCGAEVGAVVHDAETAMRLLAGGDAFDLAFIDLRLGDAMTGVDVAREAAARGIQVIAMTGYSVLPDGLEGAALLTKPFSVDTVRRLFDALGPARR